MRVITFACQKGAAGKTTLAGHIGVQAELAGAGPVAFLDTDQQGALAEWWNQRQAELPAFAQTVIERIGDDIGQLRQLGFGLGVIDSASAVTPTVEAVIAVADLVVIPCRPSPHDLRAAGPTIDMAQRLGKPYVFVLNGADEGAAITEEAAAVLAQAGRVSPVRVHNRYDYAESMYDGLTVMEVDPTGESAREMLELWAYLSGLLSGAEVKAPRKTPFGGRGAAAR